MAGQSLTQEMDRLALQASALDDRREVLRSVQQFIDKVTGREVVTATATLLEDTIDIRICLGGLVTPPPADPAPRLNITRTATPAGVNADIEAGVGPAAQAPGEAPAPAVGEIAAPVAPERPAKPAPPRKAKTRGQPEYVTGPFSEDEVETINRMLTDGKTGGQIAQALNRKPKALGVSLVRFRKALAEAVAPEPSLPAENQEEDVATSEAEFSSDWAAHLDRVGNDGRWTVERDMRLTSYMRREMGLGSAAALLRVNRALVEARWKDLTDVAFPFDIEALTDALNERFRMGGSSAAAR